MGPLLRMPSWPLNKKQTMLWKLPVIVFTYSFRGRTAGLAVVGAVSCRGSRPRLRVAQREWNRSGPQICAHLWFLGQRGGDCHKIRHQWKVSHLKALWKSPEAWAPWGRVICSQKLGVWRKPAPRVRPLPIRDPNPTLLIFSYSFFSIHFEGSISPMKRQCPLKEQTEL